MSDMPWLQAGTTLTEAQVSELREKLAASSTAGRDDHNWSPGSTCSFIGNGYVRHDSNCEEYHEGAVTHINDDVPITFMQERELKRSGAIR